MVKTKNFTSGNQILIQRSNSVKKSLGIRISGLDLVGHSNPFDLCTANTEGKGLDNCCL